MLVVQKKLPIGILTESDIIKKVVAEAKNPKDVKIKDVMTTPVIIIDSFFTLEKAMKTMLRIMN